MRAAFAPPENLRCDVVRSHQARRGTHGDCGRISHELGVGAEEREQHLEIPRLRGGEKRVDNLALPLRIRARILCDAHPPAGPARKLSAGFL